MKKFKNKKIKRIVILLLSGLFICTLFQSMTIITEVTGKEIAKKKMMADDLKTCQTGFWGTSPYSFDPSTGTLSLYAGEMTQKNPPWSITGVSGKIKQSEIKIIDFKEKVQLTYDHNELGNVFSGLEQSLIRIDNAHNWDTSKMTSMYRLLMGLEKLVSIDVSNWDTSHVTNMERLFHDCKSLVGVDVSNWDVSKVTTIEGMFWSTSSIVNVDLSKWNTSSVTDASRLFQESGVIKASIRGLDFQNAYRYTSYIFYGATRLYEADIRDLKFQTPNRDGIDFSHSSLKLFHINGDWESRKASGLELPVIEVIAPITGKWLGIAGPGTGKKFTNGQFRDGTYKNADEGTYILEGYTAANDDSRLVVNFLDEKNSPLLDSPILLNKKMWENVNLTKEPLIVERINQLLLDDYELISQPGNPSLIPLDQPEVTVNYIFKKKKPSTVTVKYVDQDGLPIPNILNKSVSGKAGETYDVSTKEFVPDILNYELDKTKLPANSVGKFIEDDIFVVYVYKKKAVVTVKYVDQSNNVIEALPDRVVNGYVSEPYDVGTAEYTPIIEGYELDKTKLPINAKGTFGLDIVVTYVYKKAPTWGTAPWTYDETTKTLTVEAGRLEDKIIGNPWKGESMGGWGISPRNINKVIFKKGVVMPKDCSKFFSDLSATVERKVIFEGLETLDTSEVTDMSLMFYAAMGNFTELILADWDMRNVVTTENMFSIASNETIPINKIDVSNWNLAHIENMKDMFSNLRDIKEIDVTNWAFVDNITKNISMEYMFSYTEKLKSIEVGKWKTSSFKNCSGMFFMSGVEFLDVSNWDVTSLVDASSMFGGASQLSNLDVSKWQTSHLQDMSGMFSSTHSLKSLDVSKWDTSNVTTMEGTFGDTRLESINLRNFDTSNVTNMGQMFAQSHFITLDTSSFKTPVLENLEGMFMMMPNLTVLNGLDFNVESAKTFEYMFAMTPLLKRLDLSKWNMTNEQATTENMFYGTTGLRELGLGKGFKFLGKGSEALPDVVKNKEYTGRWKEIGTGTPVAPNGEFEFTSESLMTAYAGDDNAGIYVWMPTGLNYEYKNRLSLTWIPESFKFGERTQISANSEFPLEKQKNEQWLVVTDNRSNEDVNLGRQWKVTAKMSKVENSVGETIDNAQLVFKLSPLKRYDIGEEWQDDYEDIIPNDPNIAGISDFSEMPQDILVGGENAKLGNMIALEPLGIEENILQQELNRTGATCKQEGFATKLSEQRLVIIGIKANTVKNDFKAKITWTMASDIE